MLERPPEGTGADKDSSAEARRGGAAGERSFFPVPLPTRTGMDCWCGRFGLDARPGWGTLDGVSATAPGGSRDVRRVRHALDHSAAARGRHGRARTLAPLLPQVREP